MVWKQVFPGIKRFKKVCLQTPNSSRKKFAIIVYELWNRQDGVLFKQIPLNLFFVLQLPARQYFFLLKQLSKVPICASCRKIINQSCPITGLKNRFLLTQLSLSSPFFLNRGEKKFFYAVSTHIYPSLTTKIPFPLLICFGLPNVFCIHVLWLM